MIGEMKEAEDIGVDVMQETFRLAREIYGDEKWGYISNRSNSYSLHPIVYVKIQEIDNNLVGYAAVLPEDKSQVYTDTEKLLIDKQFEYGVFTTMLDARNWLKSLLEN